MYYRRYLVTAEEMRALDAAAINDYGIPGVVLMENAGRSTFRLTLEQLRKDVSGMKVAVIAGPGNNGGDGYVISRYLVNHGADVWTFLLCPRDRIKGDALSNLRILEMMTPHVMEVLDEKALERASLWWHDSELIVDAILGTGLTSDVRSQYREVIEEINRAKAFKVSVDIPSGLSADTGRVMGVAVKADLTATYGFMKLGMALYPGVDYCGKIEVVDISIPVSAMRESAPKARLYAKPDFSGYRRIRNDAQAHKGTFGQLLIIGGSPGKTGAPCMAARAASKVGAGLVTVGIPTSLNSVVESKLTEEMSEPLGESMPGYIGVEAVERILELAQGKRCMVFGPGLSNEPGVAEILGEILKRFEGWVVLDADGLNALSSDIKILKKSQCRMVLTPHPGEMARLLGVTTKEVQADRAGIAAESAMRFESWIVLKGARTITAAPDGKLYLNTSGNQWMASGGQGDVLSGILGGLMVQGLSPREALPLGVHLHGLAADRILKKKGLRPVSATDVIREIPSVLASHLS